MLSTKRHGVALLTLALFVAALFGVRWVVRIQRSPGAVTVIEAQGMDMSAMKAPPGVQPVAAERAAYRSVSNAETFPATAVAYSDEEVVARVPGRVLSTSYPGDQVKSGQVVVKLQADEYATQGAQAAAGAVASSAMADAAEDETARMRSAEDRYQADVSAMAAAVARSQADRDAAMAQQTEAAQTAAAKQSDVADAQAQLNYREQFLQREQSLYSQGFTSADRLDRAQEAEQAAAARLVSAKAEALSAAAGATAATKRTEAANRSIVESQARLQGARSRTIEASKAVAKARDEVRRRQAEAKAARSNATGAGVMAGYRELRALSDSMVAERLVSPGSVVTSGQKLLMLHVADPIRLQASVPQDLAGQIRVGAPVSVVLGSTTRNAHVTSIFPQADPATRTFTVEALIRNPDHSILPGAFASMRLQTAPGVRGLSLRNSAIQIDASGANFVWIVATKKGTGTVTDWTCPMHTEVSLQGPGKCPICSMPLVPRSRGGTTFASRRAIVPGSTDGQYTTVTEGLEAGDEVIWAGFDSLIEGGAIEVTPWGSDGPAQTNRPNAPGNPEAVPGLAEPPASPGAPAAKRTSGLKDHGAKQLWTCPMHPHVVQDHPGKCPICGMDLVPKKAAK